MFQYLLNRTLKWNKINGILIQWNTPRAVFRYYLTVLWYIISAKMFTEIVQVYRKTGKYFSNSFMKSLLIVHSNYLST